MKKPTVKKTAPNDMEDTWELYPIESNHNIVRLPILSEQYLDEKSITFAKDKSIYSITERKTSSSGLISGTSTLNLDGETYTINIPYPLLCIILFG